MVVDLFIIPGHFFTPAIIEKRPPLPPTARRAGWIGSNILLRALPSDARVVVVSDEQAVPPEDVRNAWSQFAFLEAGFILKEDIIKAQWNTQTEGLWANLSRDKNFLLIMHEHLYVFRKPQPGEKTRSYHESMRWW